MYEITGSGAGRKALMAITCWSITLGVAGISALPDTGWAAHKQRLSAVFGPVSADMGSWLRSQLWMAPHS